jgi:DNA polymerase (family 10)
MTNEEIAAALEELGTLYALDGADRYRVQAYHRGARAIRDSSAPAAELSEGGRLTELPGIGKTLAEKVANLLRTGEIPSAAPLRERVEEKIGRRLEGEGAPAGASGLVELGDIRGDLQCHTTLSDGRNTLDEMARAARRRGYAYLAVTDHSASHGFGDNVTPARLAERIEEVRELNATLGRFRLLAGSEVNIRTDGSLDYPDELLAELDWVIAAVHTSMRMDERRMTDRVVAAIEHPLVHAIAHPTGRIIGRRPPYDLDFERVFEAAARTGTMLEVSADPNRLDLSPDNARAAAQAGVTLVINTDAHSIPGLDFMRYGVTSARMAGLTADQVANTRNWQDLKRLLKKR